MERASDSPDTGRAIPSEDACLDWLWRRKFSADGVTAGCPRCGVPSRYHRLRTRRAYACGRCGHQIFPAADTPFNGSSTRLSTWLGVAQLMLNEGPQRVSARAIQERFGVEYRTALRMKKRLLDALADPATCDVLSSAVSELLRTGATAGCGQQKRANSPATRRATERTNSILAAASRVLARRGLAGSRIADIAREAGVSSAMVHHYFHTKRQLLLDALQWTEEEIAARIDEQLAREKDPLRRLSTLIDWSLPTSGFLREEYQLWLEMSVWTRGDLGSVTRHESFFRFRHLVHEVVVHGQATGAFDRRTTPDVFTDRFVALADGLAFKVVLGERGWPQTDTRPILASFAEDALGLPAGSL